MDVASTRMEIGTAYTNHAASVIRYLTGITRDRAVAEDLAQEAFLRLMGEIDAGRSPANVGGWLFRVGANLAASRGRHLAVVARRSVELDRPEAGGSPESIVVGREGILALDRAMSRLKPGDREIILLAADGLDGAELAARVGKSPIAARTQLCRARARLRSNLADAGFERG